MNIMSSEKLISLADTVCPAQKLITDIKPLIRKSNKLPTVRKIFCTSGKNKNGIA